MSEVQSRPTGSRGRGSYRGGRGGHSYRGGRGAPKTTKNDEETPFSDSLEDQGEIGELKKKYAGKVPLIKEMFPDWTTEDIVFTLEETNGDEAAAIDRITEGTASQWGEVKKKHVDKTKSKVKEPTTTTDAATASVRGRSRGGIDSRGRGRVDRGRGRGSRAGVQTNGTRATDKPAKATADGWGDTPANAEAATETAWDSTTNGDGVTSNDWSSAEPTKEKAETKPSKVAPTTTTAKPAAWSSLFAKPPPPKAVPKPAVPPSNAANAPASKVDEPSVDQERIAPPTEMSTSELDTQTAAIPSGDQSLTLTPSKDELTETNLEQLPDVSHPPETATVASTVASTQDPHSQLNSANPMGRPAMSGYAATAAKAAIPGVRSASFNRRVLEQREAVVMPGDRAVDRTAVQFGSMGLGSSDDFETEEDREDPETRAQPPNDSPVAPRASLPPVPVQQQQQQQLPQQQIHEPLSAARPAPGLPPAPQQQQSPNQPSSYADYSRYGQPPQKAYDPFGQQPSQSQPQQEAFGTSQSQAQPPTTSAAGDYSSFYSANQQRDAYNNNNNYYGGYIQNQEPQQRSGSAFGTSAAQETSSQYAGNTKYGQQESSSNGNNTPAPTAQSQQQQQPNQQPMAQAPNAPGGYPYGGYPSTYGYPQYNQYMGGMHHNQHQHQYGRNRPMFDDARRYEDGSGYMGGHGGYAYGGQYGQSYGKNMYNQPQHQYSYEHQASPANTSGFGPSSMSGRDSGYRTGSAQPSESQQSNAGFGGISDPFGRSGFSGQQQPLSQQSGNEDASKTGPSPLNQPNRPDSAANQQNTQAGTFPPPQSQQAGHQAFGGYPSQYGLGGGLGSHHTGQNHQQGYGSYGGQGFSGYGYGGRNQWGQYAGGH